VPQPVDPVEAITEEARIERDVEVRHFEALDVRAGVILGFAGALVALTQGSRGALSLAGRLPIALAVLFSLATFFPRGFPVTDVGELRDSYVGSDIGFTKRRILDARVKAWRETHDLLMTKSLRLTLSVVLLAAGVVILGLEAMLR
jgi:hypothetical protein